jgi:hypothetical protein
MNPCSNWVESINKKYLKENLLFVLIHLDFMLKYIQHKGVFSPPKNKEKTTFLLKSNWTNTSTPFY